MLRLEIRLGWPAPMTARGQHSRVLAGTVVVDRRGLAPLPNQRGRALTMDRRMHAAAKRPLVEVGLRENSLHRPQVRRLAGMGSAGDGQFLIGQAERVDAGRF